MTSAVFSNDETRAIQSLCQLFKLQGTTFQATPGQAQIISAILDPNIKRLWIGTTTQYGKSLVIALAAILLLTTETHHIPIIAPSREQARIIMNYIIEHLFDNPLFLTGLIDLAAIDRLKTQFSKNRLVWKGGSEVRILTTESAKNVDDLNRAASGLMGFAGDIIIVDEAALVQDVAMGKILRMLGGNKNAKLVVIGNPFARGYFYRAFNDPNFVKIHVNYEQAIAEGRLTTELVEEMRRSMRPELFQILYEVKFIEGSLGSYIPSELIHKSNAALKDRGVQIYPGEILVGVDPARYGNDATGIVARFKHKIIKKEEYYHKDGNELLGILSKWKEELGFDWENVFIDGGGVGASLIDACKREELDINEVQFGGACSSDFAHKCYRMREEIWMRVYEALQKSQLEVTDSQVIEELGAPSYEWRTEKGRTVIKLETKEQMRKHGVKSPNLADALALTYHVATRFIIGSLPYQ